jgi:hypothetical protein
MNERRKKERAAAAADIGIPENPDMIQRVVPWDLTVKSMLLLRSNGIKTFLGGYLFLNTRLQRK